MDVAVEAVHGTEVAYNSCQPFHGIVRITHYATRQEQTLNIVATIEFHRNLFEFRNTESSPLDIVRSTVDAVGAVVHAVVGQHDFEQ